MEEIIINTIVYLDNHVWIVILSIHLISWWICLKVWK